MMGFRLMCAMCLLLAYGLFCGFIVWRHRQRLAIDLAQVRAFVNHSAGADRCVVAYASQTGQAEQLAFQTAGFLHETGQSVRLLALGDLTPADLQQCERLFCIASTYGEGDPPDSAANFVSRVMQDTRLNLDNLEVAILALGDRTYRHFCGFGHALAKWMQARGARLMFDPVEVDNSNDSAIRQWQNHLGDIAGTAVTGWHTEPLQPWRLSKRHHLNPGSSGPAIYHIRLIPDVAHSLPDWQAGDLVQLAVPGEPGVTRDYSIASVPSDGAVHLLVRLAQREDGSPGLASNWLTQLASVNDLVHMRIRSHPVFRIGKNAGKPLILIGNGSGLAGLRSHMRARIESKTVAPVWLVFGERNARFDAHYRDEIDDWQSKGFLNRVDWVFSRDQAERRYVQHALAEAAATVKQWVHSDAAIYVCGSLRGMASEVDACLKNILGEAVVQELSASGRYRRDVY